MVSCGECDAAANPWMNTASRGSRLSKFVQHNLGTVARKIDRHDQCGAHPFMEDAIVAARLICQMDQSPWLYVVSELKIARSKMPAAGVYSEESKIPSVESCEVGIDNVVKILQAVRHEV